MVGQGADLIKNPDGTIAPCGGYVDGKKIWVDVAATWLSTPGLGIDCGSTPGDIIRGFVPIASNGWRGNQGPIRVSIFLWKKRRRRLFQRARLRVYFALHFMTHEPLICMRT